jgi:hypothetical protein
VWWFPGGGPGCNWSLPDEYITKDDAWRPLRIRITEIRREPLQAITEADAIAEGCKGRTVYTGYTNEDTVDYDMTPRDEYRDLWNSINGPKSWDLNPDVWVLTFEVVR